MPQCSQISTSGIPSGDIQAGFPPNFEGVNSGRVSRPFLGSSLKPSTINASEVFCVFAFDSTIVKQIEIKLVHPVLGYKTSHIFNEFFI